MLLGPSTLLAAATMAPPGAVVAPPWFLPAAAAFTTLIPAITIPMIKGIEKDQENWKLEAPDQLAAFAVAQPNAFCVLDAGAKGAGLFATQKVPKGTYLFDYSGELLSKTAYDVRYPNQISDYCAALREPDGTMHFVDGRDEVAGSPGRWMNHNDKRPNVGRRSFFPRGESPRILMYALKDLQPGDELEWDYGAGFWAAHGGKVD